MTRKELQTLARKRIKEGKILLRENAPDGAYYLLGLGIELALKACFAKKIKRYGVPDKSVINQFYTHDLNALLKLTGLDQIVDTLSQNNQNFASNWAVVKDWGVESRYETHTMTEATDIYNAITNRTDGVMKCIKQNW